MVSVQSSVCSCNLLVEVTQGILEVLSLYNKSAVGLTMSCKSDGGFFAPLPAGMCTSWTRRRGLTGESSSCGGGWTNVGMGVGGLWYRMFVVGFLGGFDVAGELPLLFSFSQRG